MTILAMKGVTIANFFLTALPLRQFCIPCLRQAFLFKECFLPATIELPLFFDCFWIQTKAQNEAPANVNHHTSQCIGEVRHKRTQMLHTNFG